MTNKQFRWAVGAILFALKEIAYVIYWIAEKNHDAAMNHIKLIAEGREEFLKEFAD